MCVFVCVRRTQEDRGGDLAHLERNAAWWRSAEHRDAATSVCRRQTSGVHSYQGGAHQAHTHTHTAPAVTHSLPGRCGWVDCFCRDREREQFAVSVCECVHMRHMSQLFIKTPARFNTSMTIFADNYRKNTSGRKSSKFKV